jgi:hypothetical protein
MSKPFSSIVAGSIALAATAACGALHPGSTPDRAPTTIVFQNQSLEQADVFALRRSAGALRIGTVMAGRTDTLTIQPGLIAPGETVDFAVRLLAKPGTPHSGPVAVSPGQWLTITLPQTEKILSVLPSQPSGGGE